MISLRKVFPKTKLEPSWDRAAIAYRVRLARIAYAYPRSIGHHVSANRILFWVRDELLADERRTNTDADNNPNRFAKAKLHSNARDYYILALRIDNALNQEMTDKLQNS